ncbi:MAG: ABC transporter permease [Clostridia bacterium]|nr:ABC transporter permease [Clostridia bacterium]
MSKDLEFQNQTFFKKLNSMLKVDFKRMFCSPFVYIMLGVAFIIPILVLVMTSMMGDTMVDQVTGAIKEVEKFTNVWQTIGSVSGGTTSSTSAEAMAGGMSLVSMCNINMMYFIASVLVCVFISDDFRSGYAKNLFTIRSKKSDYVVSKTIVCFVCSVGMLIAYFVGALLGGVFSSLSFTLEVSVFELVMCLLSKMALMLVFVSIFVVASVFAKQRLWLSIICSLGVGMLLFMMIPLITPLNSGLINVILCTIGGLGFGFGMGAVSNKILQRTSIL